MSIVSEGLGFGRVQLSGRDYGFFHKYLSQFAMKNYLSLIIFQEISNYLVNLFNKMS